MALAFASYLLGDSPMLRKWEHPDLHFTFPTIKTSEMSGDHTPVSLDFMKEWREMLLQEGPYVLISDWMQRVGKTDADFNKQAIITADETDNLSRELKRDVESGRIQDQSDMVAGAYEPHECQQDIETAGRAASSDTLPPGKRTAGTSARNHQKPRTAYRPEKD